MFRVSGDRICEDGDTSVGAREIVHPQKPGRYHVDEIRADPLPTGHTARAWGEMIRHIGGRVEDKPYPWDR
jgi:hypothetical protein